MYTVQKYTIHRCSMGMKPLTAQQQVVLNFVSSFVDESGFPPTLREIGDAVGLANVNAVRGHLAALEKKGYITKTPDKARSIRLVHAPSSMSRFKKRLHDVLGTDEGVFHRVVYGLAWTTRGREERLTGGMVKRIRNALDREAVEHGWSILDVKVEPDHVVVIVETWPNHSASKTVQRLQSACGSLGGGGSGSSSKRKSWGKGYVVATDLELLDDFVARLLKEESTDNVKLTSS